MPNKWNVTPHYLRACRPHNGLGDSFSEGSGQGIGGRHVVDHAVPRGEEGIASDLGEVLDAILPCRLSVVPNQSIEVGAHLQHLQDRGTNLALRLEQTTGRAKLGKGPLSGDHLLEKHVQVSLGHTSSEVEGVGARGSVSCLLLSLGWLDLALEDFQHKFPSAACVRSDVEDLLRSLLGRHYLGVDQVRLELPSGTIRDLALRIWK